MISNKKILIYAAGISSRFNLGKQEKVLKGLFDFNGKKIIEYQLDWIVQAGFREVAIVLGLEHDSIKDFITDNYKGMKVVYFTNPDYKKGNMLSLWHARSYCDQDLIFTTSDLFCDYRNIKNFLQEKSSDKILVDLNKVNTEEDDPVKVEIINNKIVTLLKKMPKEKVSGVAIGVYSFSKESLNHILYEIQNYLDEGEDNKSLYYAINGALKNIGVKPVATNNSFWCDIDTPDDFNFACSIYDKMKFQLEQ